MSDRIPPKMKSLNTVIPTVYHELAHILFIFYFYVMCAQQILRTDWAFISRRKFKSLTQVDFEIDSYMHVLTNVASHFVFCIGISRILTSPRPCQVFANMTSMQIMPGISLAENQTNLSEMLFWTIY